MHRLDPTQYDATVVRSTFRQVFSENFDDGWQEWHGPVDDCYFGRFFGSSEGLEEFLKLAESAYLVVREAAEADEREVSFLDYDEEKREAGYHGWLRLLHVMAAQYPIPLLRSTVQLWNREHLRGSDSPATSEEGAPYPPNPFHTRLMHSLFVSSMAAIDDILDDTNALLVSNVGESLGTPSVSSGHPSGRVEWPVIEFRYDGVWHLKFDVGEGKLEEGTYPDRKGFNAYYLLLSNKDAPIVVSALLGLQGVVVDEQIRSGRALLDGIGSAALRKELEELQREIDDATNPERQEELRLQQADLLKAQGRLKGKFGQGRKESSIVERQKRALHNCLARVRETIKREMPEFARYLEVTVHSEGAEFFYRPMRTA